MGNKRIECSTLINIGLACTKSARMPDAENYYKQALIITREIGELRGEGLVLFNWSLLLDKQGKQESAIEQAQASFELLNSLEDPNAIKVQEQLIKWREKAKLSLT
jgi:tetratricopeptide (TPR) repeat protein